MTTVVPAVKDEIIAVNQKFVSAFNRGDAAGVASVYTPDAQALPPNAEIIHGREAIQSLWQSVIESGVQEAALETSEVEGTGDLAYEVGRYTLKAGGNVLDRGKYIVVWKRVDGQWFYYRDIWNSVMPAK